MTRRSLVEAWADGGSAVGLWCSLADSFAHEIAGQQDVDYVCTDLQHGMADVGSLPGLLQSSQRGGAEPLVRVPVLEPWYIGRVLDLGARGVIVPLVDDAAAARAVAACRYAPHGSRSFGPIRASVAAGTSDPDELQRVHCIPMIETASGLANVKAIAGVDGVSALYVGPADLALALGLPPGTDDSAFTAALDSVLAACHATGIPAGIHCTDGPMAAQRLAQGFQMVTVTSDAFTLRQELAARVRIARSS